MKKALIAVLAAAIAGWAIWYYFIREKTLGEKIDDATHKAEKAVNETVKKINP